LHQSVRNTYALALPARERIGTAGCLFRQALAPIWYRKAVAFSA